MLMPTLSISRWSRTSSFSVRALLLLLFLTSAQESRLKLSCAKGMHAFSKYLLFVLESLMLLDFMFMRWSTYYWVTYASWFHAHALTRIITTLRKTLTLALIWSKISVDFTIFYATFSSITKSITMLDAPYEKNCSRRIKSVNKKRSHARCTFIFRQCSF